MVDEPSAFFPSSAGFETLAIAAPAGRSSARVSTLAPTVTGGGAGPLEPGRAPSGRACFGRKASEGFSRARSAAAGAGWDEDACRAAVGSEGAREKIDLIPPPALRTMLTTGPIVRCANAPGERARLISRETCERHRKDAPLIRCACSRFLQPLRLLAPEIRVASVQCPPRERDREGLRR